MRFLQLLMIGTALLACGGEEGDEAEDVAALCAEQMLGNNPGNQGRNHQAAQSDPCSELGPANRQKKQ